MAPPGRAAQQSRDTMLTNYAIFATNCLFPIMMIAKLELTQSNAHLT